MGKAVFTANVRGAARLSSSLTAGKRGIQRDILEELSALSPRMAQVIREHAPRGDTDDLANSVEARARRRTVRPGFDVIAGAEHRGFAYLDVTRFGHRRAIIKAQRGRALSWPASAPVRDRDATVSFVHGYRPPGDWVEQAYAEVEAEFARSTDRLGRRLERRIRR